MAAEGQNKSPEYEKEKESFLSLDFSYWLFDFFLYKSLLYTYSTVYTTARHSASAALASDFTYL